MSPAAKIPGTLVSRYSFTATPRSILRPARSASWIRGRTPMPTTTRSDGNVVPPLSLTFPPSIAVAVSEMEYDAVFLVNRTYEIAKFTPEHAFQGPALQ